MSDDLSIARADCLRSEGVAHAFFGRTGGISEGPFASLNFSTRSGDDPLKVARNRQIAALALGFAPDALVHAKQVHGVLCLPCAHPFDRAALPEADALVTRTPGLLIGVTTADCAPILMVEPEARVVAAAHAGWKGALFGIIEATIAGIEALGGERAHIRAAIGPCIGRKSYEVGPEFRDRFIAADPANERFFHAGARERHPHFDLAGYAAARLHAAGIGTIEILDADTLAEERLYFSYRRVCLRGETQLGLQMSAIGLL